MLAKLSLLFAVVFALVARAQGLPASAKLDLFLLVGQSNMAGRGTPEPADKIPDPHVWMLTQSLNWVPAIDPLHFDKPKVAGVGPGRPFGIAVAAARPGANVGLVPCAVGGTSIDQWKKGGKLYTDALDRANAALARGSFKAILWHQGEADTAPAKRKVYLEKLHSLIGNFREDLHIPNLPFIVGEIGQFARKNEADVDAFNHQLVTFADSEPGCAIALSDGLHDRGDQLHFDTPSQRELGQRYAAAYLKLITSSK